MNKIEARLQELGISLPEPPIPVANYIPFVQTGSLVFISGQVPMIEGKVHYIGHVGSDITLEEAREAARLCAINILAQLKRACGGDLSRVEQCLRLGGFVSCSNDFWDQPKVVNAASDLMVDVFGDKGRHARTAVGTNALPLGVCVEIEGIFAIR